MALAIATCLAVSATACGDGGSEKTAGGLQKINFQFDWVPTSGDVPILAAQKFNWFKEEGLSVSTSPGGVETNPIQLASLGQKDIAISGAVAVLQVRAKNAPVVSVGLIQPKDPAGLICNPNKGLDANDPKTLEGRSIGIQDNSFYTALMEKWLDDNGVDQSKVKMIVVGNDPVVMFAGKVDCFPDFLTMVPAKAEEYFKKPAVLYSFSSVDAIAQMIVANTGFAKEHPEAVKGFVAAYAKGMQWALRNPEDAEKLLLETYKEMTPSVVKIELPALMKFWVGPNQEKNGLLWMDTDSWQGAYNALEGTKYLPDSVDVGQAFTTDYLPDPPIEP